MTDPQGADIGDGTPEGRRIVQLLWDPAPTGSAPGPRPKRTLAEVVAGGIALADRDGLAALSMRKVAAHLDVGAMSVYTYVPGRSELVELMIDQVYAEHVAPDPAQPWRTRVQQWMQETWRIYTVHPWLLDYNMSRLPIGPHVLDVSESLYAALAAAGFTGADNVAVSNLIQWQLVGAGRSAITDAEQTRHTGVSAEAYWASRASFWVTYFDYDRFPTMAAIHQAGGFDDPAGWDVEQMIERLLDGLSRLRDGLPRGSR